MFLIACELAGLLLLQSSILSTIILLMVIAVDWLIACRWSASERYRSDLVLLLIFFLSTLCLLSFVLDTDLLAVAALTGRSPTAFPLFFRAFAIFYGCVSMLALSIVFLRALGWEWRCRRAKNRLVKVGAEEVVVEAGRQGVCVRGILRPRIFVSQAFMRMPQHVQERILLHEESHICRRDVLWMHVISSIGCFLWITPLYWYLRNCFYLQREIACDDLVLESGISSYEYAEILIEASLPERGGWNHPDDEGKEERGEEEITTPPPPRRTFLQADGTQTYLEARLAAMLRRPGLRRPGLGIEPAWFYVCQS